MGETKQFEVRTQKECILGCRGHVENGVIYLEFAHNKKRELITLDSFLMKVYKEAAVC